MKKIKSLLSLLSLSALLFTACNNGDYDANPKSDLSDVPNPYEYGGATIGGEGYIKVYFNETEKVFSPARWMEHPEYGRAVGGVIRDENGHLKEEFSIMFNGFPNEGDSVMNAALTYTIMLNDSTIKEQYSSDFSDPDAKARITGFDWYVMLGRFGGIMEQNYPGDPNKIIAVSQGYFDAGK